MIRGSCACGAVRFEIDKVRALTTCHCSICRKLSGSAFGTYAHVDADKFRFLAGEDMLAEYESTPGSIRKRCKVCGCNAPGKAPYLPTVSIPAGLLDDDPGLVIGGHIFVGSKAAWDEIAGDAPQFAEGVRHTS